MRFNVLGSMEVRNGDEVLDLGPPMVRAVLAALLIEVNRPVTTDRLVDQLRPGDQIQAGAVTLVFRSKASGGVRSTIRWGG